MQCPRMTLMHRGEFIRVGLQCTVTEPQSDIIAVCNNTINCLIKCNYSTLCTIIDTIFLQISRHKYWNMYFKLPFSLQLILPVLCVCYVYNGKLA